MGVPISKTDISCLQTPDQNQPQHRLGRHQSHGSRISGQLEKGQGLHSCPATKNIPVLGV